jgi:hypothetical protein
MLPQFARESLTNGRRLNTLLRVRRGVDDFDGETAGIAQGQLAPMRFDESKDPGPLGEIVGAHDADYAGRRLSRLYRALKDDPTALGASGNMHVKVEPEPSSDSADATPPWASTICFTIASPSPVPAVSRARERSTT